MKRKGYTKDTQSKISETHSLKQMINRFGKHRATTQVKTQKNLPRFINQLLQIHPYPKKITPFRRKTMKKTKKKNINSSMSK